MICGARATGPTEHRSALCQGSAVALDCFEPTRRTRLRKELAGNSIVFRERAKYNDPKVYLSQLSHVTDDKHAKYLK